LYARLLLKAPQQSLPVLPGGSLHLQKLRSIAVGTGAKQLQVSAYLLKGVELTPQILLLDKQNHLFAQLSDSILVRDGYENEYGTLKALGESLILELLQSRVHRPGAGLPDAVGALTERLHDLVAVSGLLCQQGEDGVADMSATSTPTRSAAHRSAHRATGAERSTRAERPTRTEPARTECCTGAEGCTEGAEAVAVASTAVTATTARAAFCRIVEPGLLVFVRVHLYLLECHVFGTSPIYR
jgi:hypothetical protein